METLPPDLEAVLRALTQDESLALWFADLHTVPLAVRQAELKATAARMRPRSRQLAHALALLVVPEVFEGILARLRDVASYPCGAQGDSSSYPHAKSA